MFIEKLATRAVVLQYLPDSYVYIWNYYVLLLEKNVDVTFALRRDEVVKYEPDISQMVQRWPVLFTESQVSEKVFSWISHIFVIRVISDSALYQNCVYFYIF